MFDDPGVGNFALGEIHYGDALIVGGVERFVFEAQRAVLQLSESKIVVFVDAARENDAVAEAFPVRAVGEEIGVAAHLDACEQSVHEFVVAADGDTLPAVVEVVVVEGERTGRRLMMMPAVGWRRVPTVFPYNPLQASHKYLFLQAQLPVPQDF